jgi:hypothetical protein
MADPLPTLTEIPKYPKIHRLGDDETKGIFQWPDDEICVSEKFDGSNFRFWVEYDENNEPWVRFGSHHVDYLDDEDENWRKQMDYLIMGVERLPYKLDRDLIYCGEATKKHSLDYNWKELPPIIGFDVLHKDTGMPLGYSFAKKEFERLGLQFINVVWVGSTKDWVNENMDDYLKTSAYRQGIPEGIVIKNYSHNNQYGRPLFAKVVTEQFKEKNAAKFGKSEVKLDDTPYVVETYCTEGRVRKIIAKMKDEGTSLGRPMMGQLIKKTMHDILEEEIINIWGDKRVSSLDFKLMARLVPQKCLGVLDQVMTESVS